MSHLDLFKPRRGLVFASVRELLTAVGVVLLVWLFAAISLEGIFYGFWKDGIFRWEAPLTYSQPAVGIGVLAFKLLVIVPVITLARMLSTVRIERNGGAFLAECEAPHRHRKESRL